MEQGHEMHLTTLLAQMPKQRRTGLFSATMPNQLKNFINLGMRNPYFVDVLNKDDIFIKGAQGLASKQDLEESVKLTKFEDKASGL